MGGPGIDPKPVMDCYSSGYGEKVSSQNFSVLIYCVSKFQLLPIHCIDVFSNLLSVIRFNVLGSVNMKLYYAVL